MKIRRYKRYSISNYRHYKKSQKCPYETYTAQYGSLKCEPCESGYVFFLLLLLGKISIIFSILNSSPTKVKNLVQNVYFLLV